MEKLGGGGSFWYTPSDVEGLLAVRMTSSSCNSMRYKECMHGQVQGCVKGVFLNKLHELQFRLIWTPLKFVPPELILLKESDLSDKFVPSLANSSYLYRAKA